MTTIINSPPPSDNNNIGTLVGIITVIAFGVLFVYFGLPILRQIRSPQINIPAPVINMPDKVDVNIKQAP